MHGNSILQQLDSEIHEINESQLTHMYETLVFHCYAYMWTCVTFNPVSY